MNTCTTCGAALGAGDIFCPSCGAPAPTTRRCPGCGGEVGPTSAFCGRCGLPLGVPAAAAPANFAPPPPPSYAPPVQSISYAPPPPPVDYAPPPPPDDWSPAQPRKRSRPAPRYRGVFVRFIATLIDGLIYMAFAWVMAGAMGLGETSADGFDLSGGPFLLLSLASFGYFVVFEGLFGGTIGKLILGLRVVNAKGQTPGIGAALVRNLLRIVDALPFLYIVGIIAVLGSEKKQRIGDRAAGTYVVSR